MRLARTLLSHLAYSPLFMALALALVPISPGCR
jgi:hypothetical protein